MALLDFPTGPNTNDTTTQNGNTWKWNGTSWVAFNNLSLSSQVSGILAVQYGGTGFGGTYTAGDILYALTSNTFGKLAAGTAGSVLASGGPSTAPYWKLDEAGFGSVGNGNTGGFAYYTNLNNLTSGTAFSYISGTNNVILTNGTLSLTGSTVNSGTWAGNAISLVYGGTNNNLSGIGQSYQLAFYNATGTAITALTTGSGIANSILFQANNSSAPIWVGQSQLSVGIASSSVLLNTTTDTSSTLYLLGSRSSTGFAGTAIYVDSNISVVGNTLTGNVTGTATTATRALNTDITGDTTSQIFLTGSRSSASIGSTPVYVLSGVSALGNTITATTFSGSLSGTATTAEFIDTYTLSGTMFLTGQVSSTGVATGASQFVGSGISFNSTSGLLTATSYAGSGILLSGIVTSLASSTGISVNSATGAVTVTNTGVISLTGTANQVLVGGGSGSATSGNITLTLPQSIASTSSPSFADITLTTGSNSTLATVGSSATSLVNKQYVDNLSAGLDIHESMRVLQQPVLSANYVQTQAAGAAATGAYLISTTQVALPAIDGVTISATGASQRVLVVGGFTGTASIAGTTAFTPANSFIGNGSYFVVALGGAGTSNWILQRTIDADDNVELTGGTFTFIEEGTSYSDTGWVCSNDTLNLGSIQYGSTPITFTQFTGGGALGVGQGLTKVGNTVATRVNLFSTGTASGTGFTQFNIGGAGNAGVADTGYYPTFTVRTSGTVIGSAVLTLNSDGFSLVGSTNSNRTITVTGSDITLAGGGNTLTLTGSISLPAPTQHGIAYGTSGSAVAFLTSGGTGASVLSQTSGSAPVYLPQSQLVVGGATTAAQWQTARTVTFATGDVTGSFSINGSADVSNVVLTIAADSVALGTDTTGNYARSVAVSGSGITLGGTAGEGTDFTVYSNGVSANTVSTLVFRDGSGNFSAGTITANLTGIATSSTRVGITTSVSSSDLPIVFADAHQPYAALGSSTLLTYQASTGKITNGIWAGTAITTRGGGTGFNTVNANQVLIGAATGNTWAAIASTNLPVAAISPNPPTQPGGAIGGTQPGQLWWDSEPGVLKVYYNDGNTSQWVDATPVLGSSGGGSSTKRSYVMTFGAGFTPSTGADTVQILIPYAPDNTSKYYYIKRLDYRNETVSSGAGVSFYIDRHTTGNASFSSANRIHSGAGLSFVAAAGIYVTSYTLSSTGASFVSSSGIAGSIISGDYLRLNFAAINSAATMSVSMIIEEQ